MQADIWLNFGSFLFALEGTVMSCQHDKLSVCFGNKSENDPKSISENLAFFELIKKKSNALLYTEVRIHLNTPELFSLFSLKSEFDAEADSMSKDQPPQTIRLTSPLCPQPGYKPDISQKLDILPKTLSHASGFCCAIVSLLPVSSRDAAMWQELTERIWPQTLE